MRNTRRHFRKLFVHELENRTTPAIAATLSGTMVTFIGDGANDVVTLANSGGFLQHNLGGQNGFVSSIDLDNSNGGVQSATVASLTGISVNLGGGVNAASFFDIPVNSSVSNSFLAVTTASDTDAAIGNASIAFSDGATHTYTMSGVTGLRVDGGSGANVLDGSAVTLLNLHLRGFAGNDTLIGGSLPDRLEGGDDSDVLEGRDGNEDNTFIAALANNAALVGGNGNDLLRGGNGNDYLEDTGPDGAADGGAGNDFYLGFAAAGATLTNSTFAMGAAASIGNSIEAFRIEGDDTANVLDASAVTSYPVWLRGNGGNDTLRGGALADRLEGGNNDDLVEGNDGDENNTFVSLLGNNAAIIGGNGTDILRGGNGNDYLEDIGPDGAADGGAGNDFYLGVAAAGATLTNSTFAMGTATSIGNSIEAFRIEGDDNANILDASAVTAYPVWLRGNGGNDTLRGGALADRLEGGNDDDIVEGNDGDENNSFISLLGANAAIFGGNGTDILRGGNGNDYLEDVGPDGAADGGAGTDFYFALEVAGALLTNTTLALGASASIGNNIESFRIEGNNNANVLDASAVTAYPVWFRGFGGNDTIRGGALADRLEGGNDNDVLEGNDGDENNVFNPIFNANAAILGGNGNDVLRGGNGNDYLEDIGPDGAADGGAGIDYYFAYDVAGALLTNSTVALGAAASVGNNIEGFRIEGDNNANVLDASAVTAYPVWFRGFGGNDTIRGGALADRLEGGNDNDVLEGNDGDENNTFNPAFGNNTGIFGGSGNDTLRGGDGNDYLEDAGPDGTADGGPGSDFLLAFDVTSATITNSALNYGAGAGTANNVEGIRIDGTAGADVFDASAFTLGSVWLRGLDGNDTLRGGALGDRLDGGNHDDLLEGNGGDESGFIPTIGNNGSLNGEGGNDTLRGGLGNDTLLGGDNNDTLEGGDGNDFLDGQINDDILRDGPGVNSLVGGAGTDTVIMLGTPSADLLLVDNGSFTLNGDKSTYTSSEILTGDTLGGIDEGTQVNLPTLNPYTIANLEPTVFAGPDVANTDVPFVFVRQGTFKDIGAGQSWTGMVDYAEGGGFVPFPVDSAKQTFTLNHAYSSGGIFNVRVRIIDNQGNTGEDSFQLIRPAGIQVGVAGGAQRSMIDQITVTFADERTLNSGWYTFQRLSPGAVPTVTPTVISTPGMPTKVRFTFSGAGLDLGGKSLQDGDWKLTLNSNFILDGMGQPFDGDGSGAPGGDFLFPFHRLFGDINGDRTVEGSTDFANFGAAFGLSTGQAGFNAAVDFNVDGTIEGSTDFAQFGARFGLTI